jgi:hypothetical protein
MHIRRYLLESIRSNLKIETPFTGVWIQRIGPTRNSFPCCTLYAESETVETLTVHSQPRPQDRHFLISVNAWVRGTADDEKAESDMDAMTVYIESSLINNIGADDIRLLATDFKVSEDEPELHVCTLTYQIDYNSNEFEPIV